MSSATLTQSLRLLSDPGRLRLVLLLEREELSVAELQDILSLRQSRISTHLAQLKQAGLVEDRRSAVAAGMNDFLSKPFDPAALRSTLGRWLTSVAESVDRA